jgi:hypothetical protein
MSKIPGIQTVSALLCSALPYFNYEVAVSHEKKTDIGQET